MDRRLKDLAERLDANLIARREFLRKAAVITGGTAAGTSGLLSECRLWGRTAFFSRSSSSSCSRSTG